MNASSRSDLDKWRNLNPYYYQDIENFYQDFVQKETKVLEIGSNLGHLLNSLQPSYGLGIEQSPQAVIQAKTDFPHLNFIALDAETFSNIELLLDHADLFFDYILVAHTISYLIDIPQTLKNLHRLSQPSTRLVLTFHNPSWELILKFASLIGQRMPTIEMSKLFTIFLSSFLHSCFFY